MSVRIEVKTVKAGTVDFVFETDMHYYKWQIEKELNSMTPVLHNKLDNKFFILDSLTKMRLAHYLAKKAKAVTLPDDFTLLFEDDDEYDILLYSRIPKKYH